MSDVTTPKILVVAVALLLLGAACNGSSNDDGGDGSTSLTDPASVPTSTRISGGALYTFNAEGISVEGASRTATPAPDGPGVDTSYTVVSGDTCGAIASRFGITVAELRAANIRIDANCSNLRVDDVLRIPAGSSSPDATPTGGGGDGTTHIVEAGQLCGTIAELNGITLDQLLAVNGMTEDDCTRLQIGQVLQLP